MRQVLILNEERDRFAESDFLDHLRERMETTLLADAADLKKITLGDYLKLVALLEEKRKFRRPTTEEVIVRWKDPVAETERLSGRNI